MGAVDLEGRVARLEEAGYFQEERLKELDGQLLAQQRQLDSLAQDLERLRAGLDQARDVLAGIAARRAGETPPHSASTGWHLD